MFHTGRALTGSPTGGSFTLTFGGQTTGNIAYNASAAAVEATLEALPSVGSGNVAVIDAVGGGWEVRFTGTLAGQYQSAIVGNGSGLTGGSSPDVAVATLSAGGDVGRVAEVTDPAGRVHRSYSDPLGRTLRSIENFTDGVVTADANKTVSYGYSAAGMTSLTAHLVGGGVQTTAWLFGVSQGSGSTIDSNNVVGTTQWPDKSSGAASSSEEETTTINALGQTLTYTDRNGTTHELSYDVVGRLIADEVTAFGTGVDQSVAKIEYGYDALGNTTLITSRDTLGGIVNQVKREFNGLGQLVAEWQEHNGAVTGGTQVVQYAWSEMPNGANHSRLVSITYPDGYVLTFNYSAGLNDDVSQLSSLSDTTGTLEEYDYLGSGTVVRRAHPQPALDMTFIGTPGAGGDQYAGLDEFGRVVDLLWEETTGPTALEHIQHSYDLLGNRLTRDNLVNSAFDEVYAYDDLSQLVNFARGSHTQDWDYDALGNWNSVTTDGGTPETRTHNAQNQITGISGATTPTFDANGNMTGDEVGRTLVYDAWNRLVEVKSGNTVLKTYRYDGLNRRVIADDGTDVTDLYYSAEWQVLEERVNGQIYARYVWSPVYVDAMVLRDRDSDGNGSLDQRLYAVQDANFNVTALLNTSGNVVERFAYDPFGAATVMNASWSTLSGSAYGWVHWFQGFRYDAVARLYFPQIRPYSPTLGRPVQPDHLRFTAGDMNLFRWEGNNPLLRLDPTGLETLDFKLEPGIEKLVCGQTTNFGQHVATATDAAGNRIELHCNGSFYYRLKRKGDKIPLSMGTCIPLGGVNFTFVAKDKMGSFESLGRFNIGPSATGGIKKNNEFLNEKIVEAVLKLYKDKKDYTLADELSTVGTILFKERDRLKIESTDPTTGVISYSTVLFMTDVKKGTTVPYRLTFNPKTNKMDWVIEDTLKKDIEQENARP